MDEKAIIGFVIWLFICMGLFTFFTVPDKVGQACFGNVIGLVVLIVVLRLSGVRQRLSEPRLISLALLLVLFLLGLLLALGLGRLAQAW